MNGFESYSLSGNSNNGYAPPSQNPQLPSTAPLKLRPSNRSGPRPQQQFSADGFPIAPSSRDHAQSAHSSRDSSQQSQPGRPPRSHQRTHSSQNGNPDIEYNSQPKPPRPNQAPSARLQQALARPTSGISIASTAPSEDDRESFRRDLASTAPRSNSRDPYRQDDDDAYRQNPPPVPPLPAQPEPPKAMSSVMSAFSDAGKRSRSRSEAPAPPSRARRGGESAQGESSRMKSLNKKYPSTPAFKEIEKVLERIATEWPELLPDNEGGTDFDPVSLALSMLDPASIDESAGRLASFMRLERDLGKALKSHIQTHYRAFDASVSAYNSTLANLGSASKQVGSLRSRLAEVQDVLGTRRSELGVIAARKNELAEMERILDTVDRLKDVPDQLESLMSEKRFLSAVVLLVRSLKTINRPDMLEIGAVTDLRNYLQSQESALLEILIEEVHNHLYLKSFYCENRWKAYTRGQEALPVIEPLNKVEDIDYTQSPALGSSTSAKSSNASMLSRYLHGLSMRTSTDPLLSEPHSAEQNNTILQEPSSPIVDTSRPPASPLLPHSLDDLAAPPTSTSRPNPEVNSFTYIESLIESLACLGKLTYAVEIIVQRLPVEIYNLVEETVDEIAERHEPLQRNMASPSSSSSAPVQATSMARTSSAVTRPESFVSILSLTTSNLSAPSSSGILRPNAPQQHAHLASAETLRDLFWTLYSKLDVVLQGFRVSYEVSMRINERRGFRDKARQSQQGDPNNLLFSLVEVWKPIQSEVRALLHEYLTEDSESAVSARNMVTSINEVLRTGKARDLSKSVFRFAESDPKMASKTLKHHESELTQALKVSVPGLVSSSLEMANTVIATSTNDDRLTGVTEQQVRGAHRLLVSPDAFNVSIMFAPTLAFLERMKEILPRIGLGAEEDRGFGSLLEDFVLNTYLPQLEEKVTTLFLHAMSATDSFQEDMSYRRFSPVPLFRGATNILTLIDSLYNMLRSTPFHRENYSKLIISVIAHFYSRCAERYKELVARDADANKTGQAQQSSSTSVERLSADWARDATLSRCWTQMQSETPTDDPAQPSEVLYEELAATLQKKSTTSMIAEDQMLSSKKYIGLGHLASGMAWFSERISSLRDNTKQSIALLPSSSSDNQLNKYLDGTDDSVALPLTQDMATQFEALVTSIKQLSDCALMTIRTDLRLKCLHYLDNMTLNRVYELETRTVDPDRFIIDLNSNLAACDGSLATVLTPAQRHLVLVGLPTLIDQVLISNAKRMRSATAEGGSRICRDIMALQQNLKNLGDGTQALHVDLDRSRKYYALLAKGKPQAVVDFARQSPCPFSFDEARILLSLICRVNREGTQAIDVTAGPESRKMYNELVLELMKLLKEDR